MGVRAEQREQTRQRLVAVGRRLFAERGYAAVGLAELVREAGGTKGALYHHFPDGKESLFATVLAQVQDEVAAAVVAAAERQDGAWDQFLAGCRAFLDASTSPAVARILLVDGPAVLGWARWRALDDAASGRHLVEALEALVATGVIAPRPVAPLARLLSGAMNEAALGLVGSGPAERDQTWAELATLLGALRLPAPPPGA